MPTLQMICFSVKKYYTCNSLALISKILDVRPRKEKRHKCQGKRLEARGQVYFSCVRERTRKSKCLRGVGGVFYAMNWSYCLETTSSDFCNHVMRVDGADLFHSYVCRY